MGPIPPEELETWSDEKIAARLNELEAESGEGRVGVPRPLGRDRADGTPSRAHRASRSVLSSRLDCK